MPSSADPIPTYPNCNPTYHNTYATYPNPNYREMMADDMPIQFCMLSFSRRVNLRLKNALLFFSTKRSQRPAI